MGGKVTEENTSDLKHSGRRGATPERSLDQHELRTWRAFLRAHVLVTRRLEADLVAAGDPPLAEYDVLVQLAAAEGRALRMHELADRVLLSRAGITRLVDRLVAEGLVERQKCGLDGRGAYAFLTEPGLERLRSAAPRHLASVRRYFLDALKSSELDRLGDLLERVVDRADEPGSPRSTTGTFGPTVDRAVRPTVGQTTEPA